MKRGFLFFLIALCLCGVDHLTAKDKPDFIAADIIVKPDQFIHIKLQNKSTVNYFITPELKEKIFLTIYINNIKRAEYKIKYIDLKLFKPKGTILFRTNFRMQKGLNIKVEVNRLKEIPESDFLNNQLVKQLKNPMAWGTYMLRSPFVSVFVRLRQRARYHDCLSPPSIHPMAWGTYMLRSSFVSVFIRFRQRARYHDCLSPPSIQPPETAKHT